MRAAVLGILVLAVLCAETPGESQFKARCAGCHGGDGRGGDRGPAIAAKIAARDDAELAVLLRNGLPGAGMPGHAFSDPDLRQLTSFLRGLSARGEAPPRIAVRTMDGRTLEGVVRNQGESDLQLQTHDRLIHLLRRSGGVYREVTSTADWATYHGLPSGNRHSALEEIHTRNVSQLAARWIFTIPRASRLQVTPVVVGGIMYVTSANECYALDAGSGRKIWEYRRPLTKGLVGDAAGGINRGVALRGDRVFMVTDHAHLIALNRWTGTLEWDTEMADYRQNYGATSAPLVVGDLVISGTSGGDEGVRGFLAAYSADTGKEVWRFWTVPAPGERLAETWKGAALEHGCAATWLTGTYDPSLDLLYWPTGNPCPDYNGDERLGDNLYSNSVLALKPRTGELKWYFQFTPHDLHDWDATQVPVLADLEFGGKPRKLLLHPNRNGFFYVLDRTNGERLLSAPFVKKLTWATAIGADGRPVLNPAAAPTREGVKACPAVEGATNWFSSAFSPQTGLHYVQTLEKCTIYSKAPGKWEAGKSYYDGDTRNVPGEKGEKILRALDPRTGKVVWEHRQTGPADSWGGVLSTAGGLVFYGDDSGAFAAVDAQTGQPLWQFATGQLWKASPMTYEFDGRQHVTVAAGPNILSFALPD